MSHELPRCGRISYTNDLPVYSAIDEDAVSFPGVMMADVPARLNQALLEGQLDISPISSAFYAAHADELALVPDVCIAAYDKVHSICCISDTAPDTLHDRTIAVTRESVTGRMLLQLIARRYYGFDPMMAESDDPFERHLTDGSACLLIGDKAVDAAEQVPAGSVHDIGQLWHSLSGGGMVYAVWAVRKEYVQIALEQVRSVRLALRESMEWGLENISRVIARAQAERPRAPGFHQQYYRALRFRFDEQARADLERFILAAHKAGLLARHSALHFFDQVPEHV
ncbi:MAG TPA: menaquinone biosynthesis protein [Candidatus Eremiobacteraceae bacterium]|nr:menaquinone biosynthesis protein [Candidatus Eremiobacteraceae bacterium]